MLDNLFQKTDQTVGWLTELFAHLRHCRYMANTTSSRISEKLAAAGWTPLDIADAAQRVDAVYVGGDILITPSSKQNSVKLSDILPLGATVEAQGITVTAKSLKSGVELVDASGAQVMYIGTTGFDALVDFDVTITEAL